MSIDQKVSIFTTTMRTEFQTAYEAVAVPAEFARYTTIVPSTARIENYAWMSPSPGLAEYAGHRRYGQIDVVKYSVENTEFDASFQVLLRDIEDDQTEGYKLKVPELAARARAFPSRWVLKGLANAKTTACFDGTSFAASSHVIGTGNNLLSRTCASGDALTYKLAALFHGSTLKPLIWQNRKGPIFETDAGTPEARRNKMVSYWIDMEGQMAFGYWWNAIWYDITNTPSVAEMQEIYADIWSQFRTFTLPKSLTSEDGEYIHEQTNFNETNMTLVGSTGLENLFRQSLNQDWIPQSVGSATVATTNFWKGAAGYVVSAFMN